MGNVTSPLLFILNLCSMGIVLFILFNLSTALAIESAGYIVVFDLHIRKPALGVNGGRDFQCLVSILC